MRHVDTKIRELTNQLAPISSLPAEVLAAILEISCLSKSYAFSQLAPLVVASHVSRRFREVSVGTPSLWTCIDFSFRQPLAYLDAMLERSGTCLIDIHLKGSQTFAIDDILARIIPHVGRWRVFDASLVSVRCMPTIISSFYPLCAPHLKALTLWQAFESGDSDLTQLGGLVFTKGAPILASLDLTDVYLLSCLPPMSALTTLELQTLDDRLFPLTYEELGQALAAAPLLIHLALYIEVTEPQTDARIVLSSLRSMDVDLTQCYDENHIFCTDIVTPKLETLIVNGMFTPHNEIFKAFVSANKQTPYPALRSLTFSDSELADRIDADFFRALPTITELHLHLLQSDGNFILNLLIHAGDADTILLPHLIFLELTVFDIDLLCDTVSSRMLAGCPLRTVIILGQPTRFPEDRLLWLRERVEVF
jgi:hypothetical protein